MTLEDDPSFPSVSNSLDGVRSTVSMTKAPVTTAVATVAQRQSKRKRGHTVDREVIAFDAPEATAIRKQQTRKITEAMVPLAPRTLGLKMLLGAHVSAAMGVQNAIHNSINIGGNAVALFLKNQRKWVSPDIKAEDVKAFVAACSAHGYDPRQHILPHGSYLVNLAQLEAGKAKKAYECFVDDLKRCEVLGIGMFNLHPGSTLGEPRAEALARVAKQLNQAHKATKSVKTVLENMAGHGNVIGGTWEDLRDIIKDVEDRSRVGVCLDTCHMFAAGYDIRAQEAYDQTMKSFDEIVGRRYLCAMHINDSKAPLGARRDLHQNIGLGYIGLEGFRILMNDKRLEGIPLVLETPIEKGKFHIWADEIKLLESLIGKSEGDEEVKAMSAELQKKGERERIRRSERIERKKAKNTTKTEVARKGATELDADQSYNCSALSR